MGMQVRDTIDHDEIRRWIQLHHGAPARISDPVSTRAAKVLLVDFLGARSGHYFEHISWAEWFAWFDEHCLCFRCPADPESVAFQLIPRAATVPRARVASARVVNLSP
ncbi:hypothetical protein [Rhodococcus koreensis]|uniref:hypothetical protein n=1 Tax=Rhodococcus koreensis TaxID=99653 RepID=UPI001982517F|nr:hypothetical protein [Rhodococcus koreensis]QSE86866.1 hypothetical protein JWS14_48435 [Rhodococcus koreensis]